MSRVAFFPTLFAVVISVLALGVPIGSSNGTPWLVAHHQQTMADGRTYDVDTIGFFLWGQQYTVVGTKAIQSSFVGYDYRDYPFYSMIMIIVAIILGIIGLTADRTYKIKIPTGNDFRELKWTNKVNPVYPLAIAMILSIVAVVYLYIAAQITILNPGDPFSLVNSGYIATFGYGIQFMVMSTIAFSVASILTWINGRRVPGTSVNQGMDKLKELVKG